MLNILPPKKKFSNKRKIWYFSYFCSEHRLWVLVRICLAMFLSRNKKNNVYPCKPQFYYIKVGFKESKLYRHVFVMWDWKARLYSIVKLLDPWTKGLLRGFTDITILYSPTSSPLVRDFCGTEQDSICGILDWRAIIHMLWQAYNNQAYIYLAVLYNSTKLVSSLN